MNSSAFWSSDDLPTLHPPLHTGSSAFYCNEATRHIQTSPAYFFSSPLSTVIIVLSGGYMQIRQCSHRSRARTRHVCDCARARVCECVHMCVCVYIYVCVRACVCARASKHYARASKHFQHNYPVKFDGERVNRILTVNRPRLASAFCDTNYTAVDIYWAQRSDLMGPEYVSGVTAYVFVQQRSFNTHFPFAAEWIHRKSLGRSLLVRSACSEGLICDIHSSTIIKSKRWVGGTDRPGLDLSHQKAVTCTQCVGTSCYKRSWIYISW